VYPINVTELVNKMGSLLDINLDQVFTLTNLDEDSSKKHPFPCPTTYRTALSYYVDITALPR
jgi:NADPH-ferrihemoprotein reductase